MRAYVKDAVAALGGLDVLVNNASAFGNTDDDHGWTSSLQIDMLAIVHATQEALPALQKTKGSVVNISSISAHHPAARQPPYGAIKAAVIHYTDDAGGDVRQGPGAGELHRAGLDRVSGRRVGPPQERQPDALQQHV